MFDCSLITFSQLYLLTASEIKTARTSFSIKNHNLSDSLDFLFLQTIGQRPPLRINLIFPVFIIFLGGIACLGKLWFNWQWIKLIKTASNTFPLAENSDGSFGVHFHSSQTIGHIKSSLVGDGDGCFEWEWNTNCVLHVLAWRSAMDSLGYNNLVCSRKWSTSHHYYP